MLIASRLHFTPPPPIAHTLCAWRETDWGLGGRDNHDDRFASPAYLPCITACTLVFTHSPRRVLPLTTAPRSSDGYHADGAAY